jgi:translation elongation factor P/translation initiation factor 5A
VKNLEAYFDENLEIVYFMDATTFTSIEIDAPEDNPRL